MPERGSSLGSKVKVALSSVLYGEYYANRIDSGSPCKATIFNALSRDDLDLSNPLFQSGLDKFKDFVRKHPKYPLLEILDDTPLRR